MPRPTNCLIVDDESHVRAFLRLLLRELGITNCWEAADGVGALQLAQEHKPELVLLDVNLPGLNGLQILAQLMELSPDLPVVMVTSQSAIGTVSEAVRLGAVGYLLKHCPKDETLKALGEVLKSIDENGTESEAG